MQGTIVGLEVCTSGGSIVKLALKRIVGHCSQSPFSFLGHDLSSLLYHMFLPVLAEIQNNGATSSMTGVPMTVS